MRPTPSTLHSTCLNTVERRGSTTRDLLDPSQTFSTNPQVLVQVQIQKVLECTDPSDTVSTLRLISNNTDTGKPDCKIHPSVNSRHAGNRVAYGHCRLPNETHSKARIELNEQRASRSQSCRTGPGCFFFCCGPLLLGRGQSKKKTPPRVFFFFFAPAPGKGRGRRSPVPARGFSFPCLSPGPEQKKTPWVVSFFVLRPRADAHSLTVGLGGDASPSPGWCFFFCCGPRPDAHSLTGAISARPGCCFFLLLRPRRVFLDNSKNVWGTTSGLQRPGGATAKKKNNTTSCRTAKMLNTHYSNASFQLA